ncbi:unnamed protein product [Candidula unifasciata]|uniref:Bee-milk protein n=1 Tax=Candidula unifasciata TaxID=100452 RepID=A0A8S3ZDY7_9EUPU|nr:unnamed protein product [Candidula unifasciata]
MDLMLLMAASFVVGNVQTQTFGEPVLVHEWSILEFDWPTVEQREESVQNESYIPERSIIAGIKTYKGDVYVSIPRWFWTSGQPVTLAKIVEVDGQVKFRPYPNWAAQKQGNCQALQYVWSMEIDPNTGLMYVIDSGRVGMKLDLCPAKIVVYDLKTDQQVQLYELPDEVVSRSRNFLNDLVLDYVDGQVRYAYITDANDGYLVGFDFQTGKAYKMEHSSMKVENINDSVMEIVNYLYNFPVPIDGIAMSPDFQYVYYSVLGGYDLFQVPTSALRNYSTLEYKVRNVGKKVSQSDGMIHGTKHLYYGALSLNAVYYWDVKRDIEQQELAIDKVKLTTQVKLVQDEKKMQWPDTFALDENGWLWFVSNRLQIVKSPKKFIVPKDPHMRIWKVYVNETGYLHEASSRTTRRFDTNANVKKSSVIKENLIDKEMVTKNEL